MGAVCNRLVAVRAAGRVSGLPFFDNHTNSWETGQCVFGPPKKPLIRFLFRIIGQIDVGSAELKGGANDSLCFGNQERRKPLPIQFVVRVVCTVIHAKLKVPEVDKNPGLRQLPYLRASGGKNTGSTPK